MSQSIKSILNKLGIKYIEHTHEPVFTVAESNKLSLSYRGLHTKSLFLKSNSKSELKLTNYYLVCMQADKRLNIKSLQKHLNEEKLTFASPDELKSILNLTPGSVSIFGLINDTKNEVHLILDNEISRAESVGFHPNINTSTLELSNEDFLKFYNSLKQEKEILEI